MSEQWAWWEEGCEAEDVPEDDLVWDLGQHKYVYPERSEL